MDSSLVRVRDLPRVLVAALLSARRDEVGTTAKALAYSFLLAIPAFSLVLVGAFSLVADQSAIDGLIARVRGVVPADAADLLRDSLVRSSSSSGGGVAAVVGGFVLALWSTTSAATTLMAALTRIEGRRDTRGFLRKRLVALGIVCSLGVAALLDFGLLVLGPHLQRWVGQALAAPTITAWVWWSVQWPILILGLLAAFGVLFSLGPDGAHRPWQLVTPGAVTALVVWLLASGAFAIYSARFASFDTAWGPVSAVVVMLVWLWLTSGALLLAAEVDAELTRIRADRGDAARPASSPD